MAGQLWFKRKKFGYGWTPANWKGWLASVVFVVLCVGPTLIIPPDTIRSMLPAYMFFVAILSGAFLFLCYKKGAPPRWQWDSKPDPKPPGSTHSH